MGLWGEPKWLKLPPVVEEQFMSEPLLLYKDNLAYNHTWDLLSARERFPIKNFQKQHNLWPSVVHCPLCFPAVFYATQLCGRQCLG